MRAVDTNILVRWITRDDPTQVPLADAVLGTPVLIPLTVLTELAWTLLGKTYRMTRAEFAALMDRLLRISTVTVPDEDAVRWAVERFAEGADFADMIHIVLSRGATAFVSFERKLADQAGAGAPVPVERPA